MSNADQTNSKLADSPGDVELEEYVKASPARRALEIGALILAIVGLIRALNQVLYIYTAHQLQTEGGQPGPSFTVIVRYLQVLTQEGGFVVIVAPLLSVLIIALIRSIWKDDSRGRDRTVVSATLSVLVAAFVFLYSTFNAVETLIKAIAGEGTGNLEDGPVNGQLGEAVSAYLTTLTGHLITMLLSVAVLAMAAILAFRKNDEDGEEIVFEDEKASDSKASEELPEGDSTGEPVGGATEASEGEKK